MPAGAVNSQSRFRVGSLTPLRPAKANLKLAATPVLQSESGWLQALLEKQGEQYEHSSSSALILALPAARRQPARQLVAQAFRATPGAIAPLGGSY